jgi:hypothetical protein
VHLREGRRFGRGWTQAGPSPMKLRLFKDRFQDWPPRDNPFPGPTSNRLGERTLGFQDFRKRTSNGLWVSSIFANRLQTDFGGRFNWKLGQKSDFKRTLGFQYFRKQTSNGLWFFQNFQNGRRARNGWGMHGSRGTARTEPLRRVFP